MYDPKLMYDECISLKTKCMHDTNRTSSCDSSSGLWRCQYSIPREVQEQGISINTSLENLVGGNEQLEVSALKCMTASHMS